MIGWLMTAADAGVYVVACNVAELVLFPYLAVGAIVAPSFVVSSTGRSKRTAL